jgi:hypothetical protein
MTGKLDPELSRDSPICDDVVNDSFKSRDDDHAARARHVSAISTSSDEASATAKPRRSKGSKNWTPMKGQRI